MYSKVFREYSSVMPPNFPKLESSVNCKKLLQQIKTEDAIVKQMEDGGEMRAIFTLQNDAPADFTRAIQEEEILKVRLKGMNYKTKMPVDLPSFWDVWNKPNSQLPRLIIKDNNPNEAKWKYAIPNKGNLGYKVATTFMPGYARALYEYYGATCVLDPCAGWGDRLTGAICAKGLIKYVGFDPNRNLRRGYSKIMKYGDHELSKITDNALYFDNGFEIHSKPFEEGILNFPDESFDFAFTSPPFFDYEMYNPENPEYKNWYDEFYTPLFVQVYRCLKPNSYFGIHIGDTTAGKIMDFLFHEVEKITGFKYDHSIGLKGMMSNKIRTVWVFHKPAVPVPIPVKPIKQMEIIAPITKIKVLKKNQYMVDGIPMFRCENIPQKNGENVSTREDMFVEISKNTKEKLLYFAVPFHLKRNMLKAEIVKIVEDNLIFM